jgi:hypothetical protein
MGVAYLTSVGLVLPDLGYWMGLVLLGTLVGFCCLSVCLFVWLLACLASWLAGCRDTLPDLQVSLAPC